MDILRTATEKKKSIKSLLSKVINLVSVLLKPLTASVFWREHSALVSSCWSPAAIGAQALLFWGAHWVRAQSWCGSPAGAGSFPGVWAAGCSLRSTVPGHHWVPLDHAVLQAGWLSHCPSGTHVGAGSCQHLPPIPVFVLPWVTGFHHPCKTSRSTSWTRCVKCLWMGREILSVGTVNWMRRESGGSCHGL